MKFLFPTPPKKKYLKKKPNLQPSSETGWRVEVLTKKKKNELVLENWIVKILKQQLVYELWLKQHIQKTPK